MKSYKKRLSFAIIILLAIFFIGNLSAVGSDNNESVASVNTGSNGITFDAKINFSVMVLTVKSPDGKVFRKVFSGGST